ncbi:MAG TPA: DUF262 domain-containing protein [Candidatus Eremiobacteraceae bacterium]|nr:DUF262 domain-containing protein [Candidatus Eremiobacteraceae bacterium]
MVEKLKKDFKVEQMEPHTLTWWRNRQDKIDMDPPYQRRGRLWSDTDKAYLIDSILNGFDVPKIYMADFTWGDSPLNRQKLPYAIIDGKQRMEAIFEFIKGKIVLNSDFEYLEDPSLALGGLGYQDLKKRYPEVAEKFDEYNPLVMRVVARSELPITELFVRLNRSKPLTGAEIRNAMSGPAPEIFRQIAKHEVFTENVSFTVKRGQDLNAAAKILYFEFAGFPGETKKSSLDQLVTVAAKDRKGLELAARKVVDVLDSMSEIFLPRDKLLGSAGIFPVYYWFVRSRNGNDFPFIREFLVRFEEDRRTNRELSANSPNSADVDQELLRYDSLNRSTDDIRSHEGRFQILTKRFDKFLRSARKTS